MPGRDAIAAGREILGSPMPGEDETRHERRGDALKAPGRRQEPAVFERNEQIARRACQAAWRRPNPDYEALNELAHADHEMLPVQSLVEGGQYRGAQGFREWLASWSEMFGEDWESSVEDVSALDGERVLVTGRIKVRGLGGGVPIDQRFWLLMTLRGGKVARSEVHTDEARALKAAESKRV
jgi:ketosteroid isomerase-like protein